MCIFCRLSVHDLPCLHVIDVHIILSYGSIITQRLSLVLYDFQMYPIAYRILPSYTTVLLVHIWHFTLVNSSDRIGMSRTEQHQYSAHVLLYNPQITT